MCEQEFFIEPGKGILPSQRCGVLWCCVVITEAGDIDTHKFQLGGEVCPLKTLVATGKILGNDFGHLPARSNEAINHAPMQGYFPNGVYMRVGGLQAIVDDYPAPFAHIETTVPCQIIAWPNACRNDNHIDLKRAPIGEAHRLDLAISLDYLRGFVEVHLDAEVFDLLHQYP